MIIHRIISALLGYPDAALRGDLDEIAAITADVHGISEAERALLAGFIDRLAATDPLSAEEDYVRTFDMVPEHSLHLTHHLIGEDKSRGPALIDLTEYFRSQGVEIKEKELPDYLPLLLEFASLMDPEEGAAFLSRWNKVLRQLHANLADAGSPYAELVALVETRSRILGAEESAEAVAAAPRTDPWLDSGDFNPPVNWSEPAACAFSLAPDAVPVLLHGRSGSLSEPRCAQARNVAPLVRR